MTEKVIDIDADTGKAVKPPPSSLYIRVRSALILMPVALIILWLGGFVYMAFMVAVAVIGVREWTNMVTHKDDSSPKFLIPVISGVMAVAMAASALFLNPLHSILLLLASTIPVFAYNWSEEGTQSRRIVFGMIYIGYSISTMMWLREGTDFGFYYVMLLLFLIWASDSFAYFFGRAIGGPKLAPKVSPNKTWAGFIGSSIGAAVFVGAMTCPFAVGFLGVTAPAPLYVMMVLGAVLAMFGQAGDLIISAMKRHYDVKDTGTLIPGHGGILDRIDALLFVAPLFVCFIKIAL